MKKIAALSFCVSLALQGIGQQTPRPEGPRPGGPPDRGGQDRMGAMMIETLSAELALSPEQRGMIKRVFDEVRESSRPIQEEVQKLRQSMKEAVKAGKDAEAKGLATKIGDQYEKLAALQANSFGKVVKSLKPEQKTKADPIYDNLGALTGAGRGGGRPGFGPPPSRTPQQPPPPGR